MKSLGTNKEVSHIGNYIVNEKKQYSVDNTSTTAGGSSQRNTIISSRSASVPSVVYQEDISVKNHFQNTNRKEPLTTKMRLLITSCDEETTSDDTSIEIEGWKSKRHDTESISDRKDSSEMDSLEESEESDWFNSDMSTPEYASRRNSYNSKRNSLDVHGEMSMNNDPWPINTYPFGAQTTSLFSPTFGGRKSSGSNYTSSNTASRTSLLNVPHIDDSVFRNEGEGRFIGGVEMRPVSTSCSPNRRKSTSSLHTLQARYVSNPIE